MKKNEGIFNKKYSKAFFIVLLLLAIYLFPTFFQGGYVLHLLIVVFTYIIIASALNLVVGYMGYISFGHAAFYGIGAYFSSLAMIKLGISFWLALLLSFVLNFIVGLALGYFPLSLRVKGPYFAIVTSAYSFIVYSILLNLDITRGPMGLVGIPRPDPLFGIDFFTREGYYYLTATVSIICFVIIWRFATSRFGRALKAIREDEDVAESIGIKSNYNKIMCFAISGAFTGVAGSLYAHYQTILAPDMFKIAESTDMILMVVVGGMGNLIGPILGAGVINILPEVLRPLAEYRQIIYSFVLIIVMLYYRGGIYGFIRKMYKKI